MPTSNPHPTTDPRNTEDPRAAFYWELRADQRAGVDHLVLEDEGYLAHDINWGRRLLDTLHRYTPVPYVSPHWQAPQTPERFSDAISAILQVAIETGLDPETLCGTTLSTCEGARASATRAIRRH